MRTTPGLTKVSVEDVNGAEEAVLVEFPFDGAMVRFRITVRVRVLPVYVGHCP